MAKMYLVPVVWSMYGHVQVTDQQAASAEEAREYAAYHSELFALPTDGEYLDESFEVDDAGTVIMLEAPDQERNNENFATATWNIDSILETMQDRFGLKDQTVAEQVFSTIEADNHALDMIDEIMTERMAEEIENQLRQKILIIHDIEWDLDDEDVESGAGDMLPYQVGIPWEKWEGDLDRAIDTLSDQEGFCIRGYGKVTLSQGRKEATNAGQNDLMDQN